MSRPILPLLVALAALRAQAHDTWFKRQPAVDGALSLALGTGNQFPVFDSGIDARYLVESGCRAGRLTTALRPAGNEPASLQLRGLAQAVELRGDVLPLGIWRRADAQGRLQVTVPTAGRWLLRAIDLAPSPTSSDAWESRFVTLAFEVQSSFKSSARSASQTSANSAMTSEQPVSTTRR